MSMVTLYDEVALQDAAKAEPPVYSRLQLIQEILQFNPTVSPEFLDTFSERRLKSYRDHLVWSQEPRRSAAPWNDPDATPAIGYAENED